MFCWAVSPDCGGCKFVDFSYSVGCELIQLLITVQPVKTIWLSDHRWTTDRGILSACEMKLQSLSAPMSSSLGSVSCFSGATLALDITKLVLDPLQRNATAP